MTTEETLIQFISILIFTLLLAGKDSDSFLLKDKNSPDTPLIKKRINRWHRNGVAIWGMFILALSYSMQNYYQIPAQAILVRISIYDYFFNKWSSLPVHYLGSTAFWDIIIAKILGKNGGFKKMLFFSALSILFLILQLTKII